MKPFELRFPEIPTGNSGIEKLLSTENVLTKREMDVLHQISKGIPDKQVADKLNITSNTVAFHKKSISKKLNVHSKIELVREAVKRGLIVF